MERLGRPKQGESMVMSMVESIDDKLVIGARVYCFGCKLEQMKLIDRYGITHSALKQWKQAQICSECKRRDLLEFLPIYKGQKLEEVINQMSRENWKQNQKNRSLLETNEDVTPRNLKNKYINKYCGNGRLPLHESVCIGTVTSFVTVPPNYSHNRDVKPIFIPSLNSGIGIAFFPNGTIDTLTPLPYVFISEEEFLKYLNLALVETYDSLYLKVDSTYRKYVNVEEYYYPILTGDTIWTHFQDRFPYTHYLIFTGDNGSGKNSALLVFRYLGYRVFYVLSANAANYYTAYGNQEECQVTFAEDEADDIGENKDKRDLLKAGYSSGGTIPRIELEGGRSQDNWLVYGHKWLAMEELKEDAKTKGIMHRSIIMKFLVGDVAYNIKDVLRSGDDLEYQSLHNELIQLRKLLFCFRLIHWNDPIPQIRLNVKGRTAELVKPLIRLFSNSPIARKKIIESLSTFMQERNERMKDSFEAKLIESIQSLINARAERILDPTTDDKELGPYTFTNESIRNQLITDTDAKEDPQKKGSYYSHSLGMAFNQSKITRVMKSKFKAKLGSKRVGEKSYRCIEFNQYYLTRLKESYTVEEDIQIIESVTPVTPVTAITNVESIAAIQKDTEIAKNELIKCDNSEGELKDHALEDNK
jgi:hypothetical protein